MKAGVNTLAKQMQKIQEDTLTKEEKNKLAINITTSFIALFLYMTGYIFDITFKNQSSVSGLLYFISALTASIPIFITALKGLIVKKNTFIMEQLVSIALLAALAKSDYLIVVIIPLIISFVHFLEERSILGAQSAIDCIKTLQSKEACLITDKGDMIVPTENLKPGDFIKVKPGEMIPVDGKIIKGRTSIDQSSLTGETLPVDLKENDNVFAGTLNIQGYIQVEVTKSADQTSISKIVEIMKEAEKSKPPIMRIIDKYISYYTPAIIIMAILVLFTTGSMDRVIAVLVVSCPCAHILVSSTAMVSALSVSSQNGILIKNSAFLEKASIVENILMDKTGTLTEAKLKIESINPINKSNKDELIKSAVIAARGSNHPVSKSILKYFEDKELKEDKIISIQEIPGCGTIAKTLSDVIFLGNKNWLNSLNLSIKTDDNNIGTEVWVAKNKTVLGYILLSDKIRNNTYEAIRDLRKIGVKNITLLTGDKKDVAENIRETLNLDSVYYECHPTDKMKVIEEEKEKGLPVMMVGDGVNDALAMTKADVSISMGAMGSDIAIRSSNIALMSNDLRKISFIIKLSRRTSRVIHENMIIAILSSIIMLVLAGKGIITPISGAFLHNIGAILVILNSASILKFKN